VIRLVQNLLNPDPDRPKPEYFTSLILAKHFDWPTDWLTFRCIVTVRNCHQAASSSTRGRSRSCSSHPVQRRTRRVSLECRVVMLDRRPTASHEPSP